MDAPYDVVVIGAGPAGMIAAGRAASLGSRVLLLERNPSPGRKLLLTGNGRCNLTNDRDPARFVADCGPRGRFLHNALARFGTAEATAFFERLGVRCAAEPDGRVFPRSGRSSDVLAALARHLSLAGVEVRTGTRVTAVRRDGDRLAVETRGGAIAAPVVVVATGGVSYPRTGSTGDGHAFAAALGHAVSDLLPGEVPLRAAEAWVRGLPGVSVRDVALSAGKDRCRGDVVFTHSGLSGPAALDLSRRVAERLRAGHVAASIDLCPDLSAADVEARVRDAAAGRPARGARRTLCAALPGLPERLAAHVASPATAKDLRVTLTGTAGFDEAVVTIGGIDTREVLPATMESRLVPGLHFAGEVLDLDGPRGGYNLQIAWTTGWTAGTHAAGAGRAEGG